MSDNLLKPPGMDDSLKPADGAGYKAGRRNTWFSGFGFGGLTSKTFTDETDTYNPPAEAPTAAASSVADDIMEAPPVLPTNRRRSVGAVSTKELENLQNQASGGAPNSMLLNWLSSKRFMPSTETINETGEDQPSASIGLGGATAGGLSAPGSSGGLGITDAAKAMVEGGDGKRKMSFRDLNALSPSNW